MHTLSYGICSCKYASGGSNEVKEYYELLAYLDPILGVTIC